MNGTPSLPFYPVSSQSCLCSSEKINMGHPSGQVPPITLHCTMSMIFTSWPGINLKVCSSLLVRHCSHSERCIFMCIKGLYHLPHFYLWLMKKTCLLLKRKLFFCKTCKLTWNSSTEWLQLFCEDEYQWSKIKNMISFRVKKELTSSIFFNLTTFKIFVDGGGRDLQNLDQMAAYFLITCDYFVLLRNSLLTTRVEYHCVRTQNERSGSCGPCWSLQESAPASC